MKHSILAPLCSAFVLPGLGQVLNRQIGKGVALMGAITVIVLSLIVKLLLDLSAVMNQVMGSDLNVGAEKLPLLIEGMRSRNLTLLVILLVIGFIIWAYSIIDAYLHARNYTPADEEEK